MRFIGLIWAIIFDKFDHLTHHPRIRVVRRDNRRLTIQDGSEALADALKNHIRKEIGPIAVPNKIEFVSVLPKTRSSKIMRRVLKARAMGTLEGDTSTLEE